MTILEIEDHIFIQRSPCVCRIKGSKPIEHKAAVIGNREREEPCLRARTERMDGDTWVVAAERKQLTCQQRVRFERYDLCARVVDAYRHDRLPAIGAYIKKLLSRGQMRRPKRLV